MLRPFNFAPLLAAGLCLAAVYVPGGPQDELREAVSRRADVLATEAIRDQGATGLSLVVEMGGRPVLAKGYGFEGWEPDVRADEDTAYRVAPMLGHFLSVAVLRLVQEEKLALDDTLAKLLPALGEAALSGVELRHLLTQTSGVPSYEGVLGRRDHEVFPRAKVLEWLAGQELDNPPGTCFDASPTNLLLLGMIVEAKTGRGVQDWTQEQLFAPLDLEATHWCWAGRGPRPRGELALPFGAEGLCTSAADMGRWLRALAEGTLLDARRFDLLTKSHQLVDGTWTGAGMGMSGGRVEGLRRYSLSSDYAGSHAQLAYYPDQDLAVVAMASGDSLALIPLEQSLTRAALGLPEPGVQDLPLSLDEQAPYLGGYLVGCNRLDIVSAGERLSLETSEGPWALLLHQGEHRFIAREDPGLVLLFHMEGDRATSFTIERNGTQTQARRID